MVVDVARSLVAQALAVVEAEDRAAECEDAEARHAMPSAGSTAPQQDDGRARGWCPARGMVLPEGHSLCACGTPCGDLCGEVGRGGAGAKGKGAGAYRLTRADLALAQELAEATALAMEAAASAREALDGIAGEAAGAAALVALRTVGEAQAVAVLAVLLGLPAVPEQEEREEVAAAAPLPSRRARKAGRPAESIAVLAVDTAGEWVVRVALPGAARAAQETAEGATLLGALWADLLASGAEARRAAAARILEATGAAQAPIVPPLSRRALRLAA